MHPLLYDIYKLAIDTLLPTRCVVCERETEKTICPACVPTLRRVLETRCSICLQPNPYGLTHIPCQTPHAPDRLLTIFDYTHKPVAQTIITGKYYLVKNVFTDLGIAAAKHYADELRVLDPERTLVTPLPLYSLRQRWRGFNQSALAAQSFAGYAGLAYAETLTRTRYTRTQKNLKKDERIQNVLDCFGFRPEAAVHGKTVLLIDDVATTGSTLREATKVLKRNGARTVWCVALAQD